MRNLDEHLPEEVGEERHPACRNAVAEKAQPSLEPLGRLAHLVLLEGEFAELALQAGRLEVILRAGRRALTLEERNGLLETAGGCPGSCGN